jgi:phage terminase large subunit-like protein
MSSTGFSAETERFASFCSEALETEQGEPLRIEDFQKRVLEDFFAGVRETVVIVGKKNGKSSLLGAVAIFHLLTTAEAEVVIVAASRDQASIMLRQVQGLHPPLRSAPKAPQSGATGGQRRADRGAHPGPRR